ncbi:Uncharacterised protein [Porphyromonas macacae]|uniref:Uncharacterized protein n=1 Tax=Porphyromonas macacae TaxID=28115 RepID=A0A379E817_9PORP|nr:hypothetical protein [Porphyromonas macacae]SUB88580.1 Uncharacterised protein [Porphyromonas macacae]
MKKFELEPLNGDLGKKILAKEEFMGGKSSASQTLTRKDLTKESTFDTDSGSHMEGMVEPPVEIH